MSCLCGISDSHWSSVSVLASYLLSSRLLEVLGREHQVNEEIPKAFWWVEFVQFVLGQMDLVELLVLRAQLLFLRLCNIAFFLQLILHKVLHLFPEFNLLSRRKFNILITSTWFTSIIFWAIRHFVLIIRVDQSLVLRFFLFFNRFWLIAYLV